jgi:hypothetical protein
LFFLFIKNDIKKNQFNRDSKKTYNIVKKIFFLLSSTLLLNGCVETMALLGPAGSFVGGGNVVHSSISSAASYAVKKSTGKSPMQHALAYAEENNPQRKKERCISFIDKTNSEACAIINKKVLLTKNKIKKKTKKVLKNISLSTTTSRGQAFAKARKEGKDIFMFNGRTYNTNFKNRVAKKIKGKIYSSNPKGAAKNFFHGAQIAIEEKSKIKYLNQQP